MSSREKRVRELEDAITETIAWIETQAQQCDPWIVDHDVMLQRLRDLVRIPEATERHVIGAPVFVPADHGGALREREALREMVRLLDLVPHHLTSNACPHCYGLMERVPITIGLEVGGSVATADYTLPLRCAANCGAPVPASYSNLLPAQQTAKDIRKQLVEATAEQLRATRDAPLRLRPEGGPVPPWRMPDIDEPAQRAIRDGIDATVRAMLAARCEHCGGPMRPVFNLLDDPDTIALRCVAGCA